MVHDWIYIIRDLWSSLHGWSFIIKIFGISLRTWFSSSGNFGASLPGSSCVIGNLWYTCSWLIFYYKVSLVQIDLKLLRNFGAPLVHNWIHIIRDLLCKSPWLILYYYGSLVQVSLVDLISLGIFGTSLYDWSFIIRDLWYKLILNY